MNLNQFTSGLWGVARQGNAAGTDKVAISIKGHLITATPGLVLRNTEFGTLVTVQPDIEQLRKLLKTLQADAIAEAAESAYEEGFDAAKKEIMDDLWEKGFQEAHQYLQTGL